MGLDQYAYAAAQAGQQDEYYDSFDLDGPGPVSSNESLKPRELMYWRKHPNLQGWMEQLWLKKNPGADKQTSFNGIELELTWDDIEDLERAIIHRQLPATRGFFFGDDSDEYYYEQDLDFVKQAKTEIFVGLRVFYNSSW